MTATEPPAKKRAAPTKAASRKTSRASAVAAGPRGVRVPRTNVRLSVPEQVTRVSIPDRITVPAIKTDISLPPSRDLAFYAGIVVSFPLLLYFLAGFVLPALTVVEKRFLFPAIVGSFGLFLLGVVVCYFWLLPKTILFFFRVFRVFRGALSSFLSAAVDLSPLPQYGPPRIARPADLWESTAMLLC